MSGSENQRLEGWLRKLLDLTLRNPLINLRPARGLSILRPLPAPLLESLGAAGEKGVELVAFPWSDTPLETLNAWKKDIQCWPTAPSVEDVPDPEQETYLLRDEASSRGRRKRRVYLADETWDEPLSTFARGSLLVDVEQEDLQDDLADLDRQQRLRQQEGGVHTLYLALGLLRWKEQANSANWIESPLVLVPVQLSRKSAQHPYTIALRDESPVFNPSLAHKIRQDFGLDIEIELPQEEFDPSELPKVWEQVAAKIAPMQDWTIMRESRLGLFSFHKQHLWNDLAARTAQILDHPVVARIAGHLEDPGRTDPVVDFDTLDARFSPKDLLTPLPVDASQLRALTLVDQGHNLVIDGPPGTGKSQTITNLIAHALGKGKTVLFVSEKATALSVVHDRLEDLGLGPFCLDLHSSKAQKSEVAAQFRRTMDVRTHHDGEEWSRRADNLQEQRRQLNDALAELHQKRANGYSLFQAIGLWTTLSPPIPAIDADLGPVHMQGSVDYEHTRKTISTWARASSMLSSQASRFSALSGRSIPEDEGFLSLVDQALDALFQLENNFRSLGVSSETLTPAQMHAWMDIFAHALSEEMPRPSRQWLLQEGRPAEIQKYYEAKKQSAQAWGPSSKVFAQSVLSTVASWKDEWQQAASASLLSGWMKRRAVRKSLAAYTLDASVPSDASVANLVHAWPTMKKNHDVLKRMDKDVDTWMRREVKKHADWAVWLEAADWARRGLDQIERVSTQLGVDGDLLFQALISPPSLLDNERLESLRALMKQFDEACASWRAWFPSNRDGLPENGQNASVESWRRHWQEWRSARPSWPAWRHTEQAASQLRQLGLDSLMVAAQNNRWSPSEIEEAWMAAYWRTWISRIQESIPQWEALGRRREDSIEEFAKLDTIVEHETRHEILARLCAHWRSVERSAPPAETRLLMHELGKKRSHLPPRQLLARTPTLWPAMKPCLLMSPLSAAQHLSPDTPMFDLVVFDEASQISVADAVGVIARGKQVVIVGDPKQMPPSRLFDASDDEEDPLTERDLDSILDECVSTMNRVLLNWHYRSRHEDLIAFSNHRYYNGELITFPSPHNRDDGIVVREINGGYERSGRRINRAEAEAVVEAVVSHYCKPGAVPSLGVITFNQNQQRLINRMIDNRRATDPAFDAALSAASEELFVKNLETVQGDERDIIFFSTTFAPDAAGNFPLQFGPLGQLGGERRLNVAITRARARIEVFTSFHPGQMDVSNVRHQGIKDLRDYLVFARGGEQALLSVSVPTLGVADSPFEISVRQALEDRGWDVVPQVGCSGYRIDMAVKDPDRPGEYLAGIECDGATYHSFKVARDRDRVRQRVLERLGWKIARIWSTDWWQDATAEVDRIDEILRGLRKGGSA